MASMKILPLLLVLAFTARNVVGQRTEIGIPGTDDRVQEISQDPFLFELAARTGEMIQITIDGPDTVGIVQEGVNAALWCLPWLQRFPGGSIRWLRLSLTFDGDVRPGSEPAVLNRGDQRLNVNGEFDEWLNISRTLIASGAELADSGIYMCEVCIARGSPFEECHTANVTFFLIGGPPIIDSSTNSTTVEDTMADVSSKVGEDICLPAGFMGTVTLSCGFNSEATDNVASARPTPSRAWFLNGDLLYRAMPGDLPDLRADVDAMFYMDPPERMLLFPGVLSPSALSALGEALGGGIRLTLEVTNVTENMLPSGVTAETARMVLMEQILGDWRCEVNNTFGEDDATTNIRICGDAPSIPRCSQTIFGMTGDIVPTGCAVCIPEGNSITLDCTASSTSPVMYVWTDSEGEVVSRNPLFVVDTPGNYTCVAENVDNPSEQGVTALFYSDSLTFTAQTTESFASAPRPDNGCTRLSNRTGLTADLCIFVGETLDLMCRTDDRLMLDLEIADTNGMTSNGSLTISGISSNQAGNYSCRLSTDTGPCGGATSTLSVEVFDPAAIDRTNPLADTCTYGAGRFSTDVVSPAGSTVVLCCPVTGIEDPTTTWYRIDVDEFGMAMETALDSMSGSGSVETTITVEEDATYVCRTSNRAGADADIVTIRTQEEMGVWDTGDFSDCSLRCRDGIRRRSVVCRSDRDGMILPDTRCDAAIEPARTMSCADVYPALCLLDPVWISSPWGACRGGCKGGIRYRDVVCQVPMTGAIEVDSRCNGQVRPARWDYSGCPPTCCVEDEYPAFCRFHGSGFCGDGVFQQFCCWTCGLTVKY